MRIERFEDIKAWQEARALVAMVYEAVNEKGDEFRYNIARIA
jgi:hypothetical protein